MIRNFFNPKLNFGNTLPRRNNFQNLQKLNFYSRKLKMCKFFLTASVQKKLCKMFFGKNCPKGFFLFKAFQRAVESQNPMNGSRSKFRFSRVKVK